MFWSLETREALEYTAGGRDYEIPAASAVSDAELVGALRDPVTFAEWAQVPFGYSYGKVAALRRFYCRTQGLPDEIGAIDRLVSILERFDEQLEIDLQRHDHLSLVELWRTRQWRRLQNHINHIPQASFYRQEMLNDEKMVEMLLERQKDEPKQNGFAVSEFPTEVAVLRDVVNAVKQVGATLVAVNSKDGKMPKIDPYPGPITAMQQAEHAMRKRHHEELMARVGFGKKDSSGG